MVAGHYTVGLGDVRTVKARYQAELSHGGCFVPTRDKLAAFSLIRLRLELPVGPAVELDARVVNPTSGGVFVQFEPGPERDALDAAIEFLESIASGESAPAPAEEPPPVALTPTRSRTPPPESGPLSAPSGRAPWALVDPQRPLREQVAALAVADRITLARFGGRAVRDALIADPEAAVVAELLANPRIGEAELLAWVARDDLPRGTLDALARAPAARCRPRVLEALSTHPRRA